MSIVTSSVREPSRAAAEAAYARVVSQLKLRMEQLFIQQGNEFASTRARAHYYVEGAADEACTGVSYYHFPVSYTHLRAHET